MSDDTHGTRFIRWFDDPDSAEIRLVGGKGANLGRMAQAGFPVPPGFVVIADAYRAFMSAGGLGERVMGLLEEADDIEAVEAASAVARSAIRAQPVPPEIGEQIRADCARLDGGAAGVAVRSSATAEDLPEASFAGQQDTYLNVRGAEAVVDHVRRCWASLWTARAIDYRHRNGFDHGSVLLAVVVQAMIESETAGVLFTVNPVTGRRDESVINASYGLGEAVVSGVVTPDTYIVEGGGLVRQREIGRKTVEIVYAPDGTVTERPITDARVSRPSLDDAQVLELAALGRRVAEHFGAPQDIEWAYRDGRLYLLQSRPVTTLGDQPVVDPRDHWSRAMFVEILPDAPSPVFGSVLEPVLARMLDFTFQSLAQHPPRDVPAIGLFYHQPYLNLRYIRAALSGLPEASRERLTSRIGSPFSEPKPERRPRPSVADARLAWSVFRAANWLPRRLPGVVERYYGQLEAHRRRDPGSLDDAALVRDIRAIALELLPPLIEHDFLLIFAMGFVQQVIDAMVARSGLAEPERTRGQLMSGVTGNLTMQTNKALWQLARTALRAPDVAAAIAEGPDETLLARVRGARGGGEFGAALDGFLAEYGHRELRMDIASPTWGEDPVPVLGFVRAYLMAPDAPDPAEQERELAGQRRSAAKAVRAGLGRTFVGRVVYRPLFRWALARAVALGRERDTMHFHWTASFPVLRRLLRELGRRLTEAGWLDRPADVFCLTVDDLDDAMARPDPLQPLVARRKRAWERDRARQWPLEIREGTETYEEAAPAWDVGRARLRGIAGSPGKASGPVRVIRGPQDFGKLVRGDILVAPLTNPAWTPLFAVAGGVVTDSGGILSHGAIVAREYGIPAVMGARGATRTLHDGQRVTVDGIGGVVVIEEA